jgi:Uncharacterized conserved protein
MEYYFSKTLDASFDEAVQRTTDLLKAEGFGIISEINIHEKLKEKLGVDFKKYRILGACNPKFAHQALQEEARIGLLLPCNVIVQESGDKDVVEVAAIDPAASMQTVANPRLDGIALQVQAKLQKVIAAL